VRQIALVFGIGRDTVNKYYSVEVARGEEQALATKLAKTLDNITIRQRSVPAGASAAAAGAAPPGAAARPHREFSNAR
jgi:hypothetical protein